MLSLQTFEMKRYRDEDIRVPVMNTVNTMKRRGLDFLASANAIQQAGLCLIIGMQQS